MKLFENSNIKFKGININITSVTNFECFKIIEKIKISVFYEFLTQRVPENYTVNSRKKFLEMRLDHMLFVGLTEDLQKIFITKKVEPGKSKTLFLENQLFKFLRAIHHTHSF